ncbi:ABC transporter permease [Aquincola sp. S2]|uniref:ABC transporter permease n=1 Tax=Pseudaquabacterium terrae TaxID=2732868 RepID=A0ABX2EEF8_9BURK|nr:ABC transporter permease [Aquabacterium terrae]NRF67008.1 ABC transporter permease [Aquabacterium terrae]
MRARDILAFARDAAGGSPLRTALMMVAMAIGVAAVVVLTALGDGARRYVVDQFSSIGSNLVIVLPGRSQTGGLSPASAITTTTRDLTVADARALQRATAVRRLAPIIVGLSDASTGGRLRETTVVGTTSEFVAVRRLPLAQGRFLPDDEWSRSSSVIVLGSELKRELFGAQPALGQWMRLGERRLRVIGVLAPAGQGLNMNTDQLAIVPVVLAQAMFNSNTLFRILVEARSREAIPAAKAQVIQILKQRHDGEADVTVITQDAVLATFDRVLTALTAGVAGIAAISLAVAGILVMNVMLVSVTQRSAEVGLLKALGASARTIRAAFLTEAALLSLAGAVLGYGVGHFGAFVIRQLYPVFPAWPPTWAVLAALATALVTGILFGVLPAQRAAALDPVAALGRR